MAEDAELWFPEVAIGTFMGCGATVLLPRLVGLARARRMLLLGERLRGAEAVAAGLATHCFAATVFEQGVLNLAGDIAARAPVALRLGKSHLNAGITRDYETALLAERDAVLACMMTDDWKEGVRAFAEKRKPVFGGR
jgi:enoyl-CoA hydratase